MRVSFPEVGNNFLAASEISLESLSLEELFLAAEAGQLPLFENGAITPLGRLYYSDRCERPIIIPMLTT